MSSNSSKEPAYYKNGITDDEIKKLEKIFDTIERDNQAYEFLAPVDYVALNMSDLNLIWKNCRTYNLPGSEIVKMANHCDKK